MTCGIYLLGFNGTHKVYIGQSKYIEKRYTTHCNDLRNESHTNKMQDAFKLYGYPELEIVDVCTEEQLNTKEKYHIKLWDAVSDGFNSLHNPAGGACSGELNYKSLYTDSHIISVFLKLVNNPEITLIQLSKDTDTNYNVIKNISNGSSHKWLEDLYPKEYFILMQYIGTRNNKGEKQGSSKYSNNQIYSALCMLLFDITTPNKVIAKTVGISENVVVAICNGKYKWLQEEYPEEYTTVINALSDKRAYSRSAKARGISYPPIVCPDTRTVYIVDNVNKFAKEHGLDTGSLNRVLNRKANSTKGWVLQERMPP